MTNIKNYYAETNKIQDYISDCTYYVFEKFIIKGLPLLFDNALKTIDGQIDFGFRFKDIRDSFGGKIANIELLETRYNFNTLDSFGEYLVNVNEFISYLEQIPGIELNENTFDLGRDEDEETVDYSINTKKLIEFYYQELQRIEYYDSRVLTRNKISCKHRYTYTRTKHGNCVSITR